MMLEIQVLVRDRHKSVAGLNHLMLFQPPSWYLDFQPQYINKQTCANKLYTIAKIKDNKNIDSVIVESMNVHGKLPARQLNWIQPAISDQ